MSSRCDSDPMRKMHGSTFNLAIAITTLCLFCISCAVARQDDACRGNCDRFRDRYCEEWIGSCEQCLLLSKIPKCIEYFNALGTGTQETTSGASRQKLSNSLTQQLQMTTITPTTRSSLDQQTSKEDGNRSQDQTATMFEKSENPRDPKTGTKNRENLNNMDQDSDGGSGNTSGATSRTGFIVASCGAIVVMATGLVFVLRRQNGSRPQNVTAEDPRHAGGALEEENKELVGTPTQEEGAAGGALILPAGDQIFMNNEEINMETAL